MGIDIYLRWRGQTKAEEEAQYTGFSVQHGHVGYLREAYHGGPYATKVLFPETWADEENQEARIPNAVLRERMPEAIETALVRERRVYARTDVTPETCDMAKSIQSFIELHGQLEEEGKDPWIVNSY